MRFFNTDTGKHVAVAIPNLWEHYPAYLDMLKYNDANVPYGCDQELAALEEAEDDCMEFASHKTFVMRVLVELLDSPVSSIHDMATRMQTLWELRQLLEGYVRRREVIRDWERDAK